MICISGDRKSYWKLVPAKSVCPRCLLLSPRVLSVSALLVCFHDYLLSQMTKEYLRRKERRKGLFFFCISHSLISFSHFPSIVEKDHALISYNSSSLSVDLWLCPYSARAAFGLAPGKDPRGHSS